MDGTHQESPTGESFEDASQFKSGADAHVEALLAGDSVTITLFIGGMIALVILGGVLYKTFVGNNRGSTVVDGLSWTDDRNSVFIPPKEREEHLNDKKNLDLSNPENVRKLKQSLMKRTFVSIPYLLELQTQGPSADKLYKRGMMTDAMYDRYKQMKAFFDVEFPTIQSEANALVPGWGQQIWQQANHIYQGKKAQQEKENRAAAGSFYDDDESFIRADEISSTVAEPGAQTGAPVTAQKQPVQLTAEQKAKLARQLEAEEEALEKKRKAKGKKGPVQ